MYLGRYIVLSQRLFFVTVFLLLTASNAKADVFADTIKKLDTSFDEYEKNKVDTGGIPRQLGEEQSLQSRDANVGDVEVKKFQVGQKFNKLWVTDSDKAGSIYPGALILGHTVPSGEYEMLLDGVRKPVKINIDLTGSGPVSATINPQSLSSYREAFNKLIHGKRGGSTSATANFEHYTVHSKDQLKWRLGVNSGFDYKGLGFRFDGSGKTDRERTKTQVLVRLTQQYYSVAADKISKRKFFEKAPEDLLEQLGDKPLSPVYVSKVGYGRVAYISIISKASKADTMAAVEASISIGKKHSGSLSQNHEEVLNNSEIRVKWMGDERQPVVNGAAEFISLLKVKRQIPVYNPGVPINYTLRWAARDKAAKIMLYSEYTTSRQIAKASQTEKKQPVSYELKVSRMAFSTNKDFFDAFPYGRLWAIARSADGRRSDIGLLWNRSVSDRVEVEEDISARELRMGAGGTTVHGTTTLHFEESSKDQYISIEANLREYNRALADGKLLLQPLRIPVEEVEKAIRRNGSYQGILSASGDGHTLLTLFSVTRMAKARTLTKPHRTLKGHWRLQGTEAKEGDTRVKHLLKNAGKLISKVLKTEIIVTDDEMIWYVPKASLSLMTLLPLKTGLGEKNTYRLMNNSDEMMIEVSTSDGLVRHKLNIAEDVLRLGDKVFRRIR